MPTGPAEAQASRCTVRAYALTKVYGSGGAGPVTALDAVTVGVERGTFMAIMGPSGSGKSTLLHCLAGLDTATSGSVEVGGVDLGSMSDRQLTRLRRDRIGFVFQAFNLVPTLSAAENITLPADLGGRSVDRAWMAEVVSSLGLADRLRHRPSELSGGQQQRVAVARALLARPDVIFADEPTGNLDSAAGTDMLRLLQRTVHELGQTVVMVTHDPVAAGYADRALFLADGAIISELHQPTAERVLDAMLGLGVGS